MIKRKVLVWLLSGALLGTSIPVYAAESEDSIQICDDYNGYTDVDYDVESIYEGVSVLQGDDDLPADYDSREKGVVTAIKNQNPWGTCWSFSAIAALESSLLSQGIYEDIDLSEYHLINYNFWSVEDPLGGTNGDSVTYNSNMSDALGRGGNVLNAFRVLASWTGAVEQDETGYPTEGAAKLPATVESAYLNDIVHLQQAYIMDKEDVPAIKKAIMEYGTVTASMYYADRYLNSDNGAYYNSFYTNSNHAIAIVGWDDDYSKDNFLTQPDTDGAWLVKNSWGTTFGQDGYIWMSYEDRSLQDELCVLVGEKADNYDNNYQYDGSHVNKYLLPSNPYAELANVFQIQAGENQEALQAVSFESGSVNTDYSIQIYIGLEDDADPTSGTPMLATPVTGQTTHQGYYTVELPKEILLNPGERFAVVLVLSKDTGDLRVVLENSMEWNDTTYVASAKENQSFLRWKSTGVWTDNSTNYHANLRIKAFTSNTQIAGEVPVESIALSESTLELDINDSRQLAATVLPEDATTQILIWTSSNEAVATVDSTGMVNAVGEGTATITVMAADGSGVSATCEIQVSQPVTSIELSNKTLKLEEEDTYNLQVTILPDNATNALVEWTTSDATVATVDENGKVTAVAEGTAVIGATSTDGTNVSASCTVTVIPKPKEYKFADINAEHWGYPYAVYAYESGIMSGKGANENGEIILDAEKSITRAEFVQILYNAEGKPAVTYTNRFSDVEEGKWYTDAILWAAENGVTAGKGEIFDINSSITRQEIATMLCNYARYKGWNTVATGDLSAFTDSQEIATWAQGCMKWAVGQGVIKGGGGRLSPNANALRIEAATMYKNLLDANQ